MGKRNLTPTPLVIPSMTELEALREYTDGTRCCGKPNLGMQK